MMVGKEEVAQANCQMFFELLENDEQDEAKAALAHMMQTGEYEDVKCKICMSSDYCIDQKKEFWKLARELTTTRNQPSQSLQPGAAVENNRSRYCSINNTTNINSTVINDHNENIEYKRCRDSEAPKDKKTVGVPSWNCCSIAILLSLSWMIIQNMPM